MFRVRKRTGIPRSSTWTPITTPKSPGLIRMARNCTPTQITTWAATPSFTAPRCSGCAKKISVSYDTCDGFACLVGAKSDSQVVCVDEAIKNPNVTLLTNSLVKRLETDSSGREIKGVLVERNGSLETYAADLVVVSCGAINSAALLLRSASDKHPRGLANSSDIVGRHYMGHTNSVMMAISKCPNPTIFQKTLGVNDFYFG